MTKRIIAYVLTSLLLIAFFSVILSIQATTNVIGKRQETKLLELLEIIYYVHEEMGDDVVRGFETTGYSITLLNSDGTLQNPETTPEDSWYYSADEESIQLFIKDVMSSPETVISSSTSLISGNVLLAGIESSDGTIIVVATALTSFIDTISDVKMELLYIILVCILLSTFLARLISYLIVQPLNDINVEAPTEEDTRKYKEILPLLNKITEQKEDIEEQQKELRQGESRFDAISETLVEGMVLIEASQQISYINSMAIKILSPLENPIGKNYKDFFSKELQEVIQKTVHEGNQTTILYNANRAYQVETSHLMMEANGYDGVALLIYDVTERMALERDRRDFTANVSHELKTPLHVITGSAELLELGIVKEEDQKVFINQIYTEAKRMAKLIEDIIKLSRLDDSNYKMEKELIHVKPVCADNLEAVKKLAAEHEINLLLSGDDVTIKCNGSMFNQIIYNLLTNAIKYNNPGGNVEIRISQENGMALIDVKDNGVGIPKESQDKIFDRFYCVDKSRSRKVGGTGLGLAIVKNASIENGGDVVVYESEPGKGTTFRVSFPVCADDGTTSSVEA